MKQMLQMHGIASGAVLRSGDTVRTRDRNKGYKGG